MIFLTRSRDNQKLAEELGMKITRCKYGHYYDKAYFRECPHCCRKRGGRDEDIIIKEAERIESDNNRLPGRSQNAIQDEAHNQKEKDRENVKRWIGEAWDELEEILGEDNQSGKENENNNDKENDKKRLEKREYNINNSGEKKDRNSDVRKEINKEEKTKRTSEKHIEEETRETETLNRVSEQGTEKRKNYMLFAAMPMAVIKNQEFCMDFCMFPEREWETGAKMLAFKSQESIRDLKPVQIALPAKVVLRILYKEEEICHKEMNLDSETEKVFCTFPVSVTDTRDRRFHMIKAVFEVKNQNIEIPLYLVPNP